MEYSKLSETTTVTKRKKLKSKQLVIRLETDTTTPSATSYRLNVDLPTMAFLSLK